MDITSLLSSTIEKKASDLHLSAGEVPMMRIDGDLKRIEGATLINAEQTQLILYDIMNDLQRKVFEEKSDIDFSLQIGTQARFRVNIFRQNQGMAAVFRVIPSNILTSEQLNLPPIIKELSNLEKGLILVTGPTGSGKSTTLSAMVDHINSTMQCHILTVEDPIEFIHKSKKSLINQREIGAHTNSFATALKAALREDPDVILIGEMRDLETIQLALTAAETGHLVFGTLHTSSAPKTMDRIVDVFPPTQQAQIRAMLAESLQAVICQTLCKKIGGGRIAALEILIGTTAVRNLIRENKIHQIPSTMQTSQNVGMKTMEGYLMELFQKNLITAETVMEKTVNNNIFNEQEKNSETNLVKTAFGR